MNTLYNEMEGEKLKGSVEREVTIEDKPGIKKNVNSKYKYKGRNLHITVSSYKKLHESTWKFYCLRRVKLFDVEGRAYFEDFRLYEYV